MHRWRALTWPHRIQCIVYEPIVNRAWKELGGTVNKTLFTSPVGTICMGSSSYVAEKKEPREGGRRNKQDQPENGAS